MDRKANAESTEGEVSTAVPAIQQPEGLTIVQQDATPCNIWENELSDMPRKMLQHKELSQRQMLAVLLMLHGQGDIEVARRIGVTRSTVFRWRTRVAPFREELAQQRQRLYEQATDRLGAMIKPALGLLEQQLADPVNATNPRIAMRIAATVVRLALQHQPKPPAAEKQRRPNFAAALDAYINAPLPGMSEDDAEVD